MISALCPAARRVTFVAVAVVALAIGLCGTAAAQPASSAAQTSRYTVTNNSKMTVYFIDVWQHPDMVVAAPKNGTELKVGDSVWFDVKLDDKNTHQPMVTFTENLKVEKGVWFVTMHAKSDGDYAECVSNQYVCSPASLTKTSHIYLK